MSNSELAINGSSETEFLGSRGIRDQFPGDPWLHFSTRYFGVYILFKLTEYSFVKNNRKMYEVYPENKFRLRILPLQCCGHDDAHACRVCGFCGKARTKFSDIPTVFKRHAVCL